MKQSRKGLELTTFRLRTGIINKSKVPAFVVGITVVVDVEKENESPVEQRTDGKPLADVVAGWIWYPSVVDMLGLSDSSTEALQRVEMSSLESYSSAEKKPEPKDVWQNPRQLRKALEDLREIFRKLLSDTSLLDDMETREARDNFYRDVLENGTYDAAIEDGVKACIWAEQHNRRVRLRAS